MNVEDLIIKTASLNNHCPECYSTQGLKLSFSQRSVENAFYKSLTNKTSFKLNCDVCNSEIFPVNWTEDIERVVAYHKKALLPEPRTFKLKTLAWILLIILDTIILLVLLIVFDVIKL